MRRTLACLAVAAAAAALGIVVLRGSHSTGETRGQVDDRAKLLWPLGVVVERQCAQVREDLGVDLRVATLRDCSEDVAPTAERLFRELGVGREAPTGGILILLEAEKGRARIEVSYSLEGLLPDLIVSRIARDQLVPYASHRAAGMAVMDVVHFLRNRLLDGVATGEIHLAGALREPDHLAKLLAGRSGGAGAQVALPELPSHTEYKRRIPDARRALYAPSTDPRESAAALQRARRDLAGDPTLELFTEGSRVMRARYPVAPYEELLRVESTERSEPLELQVRGDRAYLGSPHPVRDFVPVLLVREGGLWRVDLVETFKSFFFDAYGNYVLVNTASPYAAFQKPVVDRALELAPLDLGGEPIEAALARLERSSLARDRFRMAEILMRNCFVSAEAIPAYAEAAAAAPRDATVVLTYADRAAYLYMPEIAADAVAGLGPDYFTKVGWLYESAGKRERAREYYAKSLKLHPRDAYAREALERLAQD